MEHIEDVKRFPRGGYGEGFRIPRAMRDDKNLIARSIMSMTLQNACNNETVAESGIRNMIRIFEKGLEERCKLFSLIKSI